MALRVWLRPPRPTHDDDEPGGAEDALGCATRMMMATIVALEELSEQLEDAESWRRRVLEEEWKEDGEDEGREEDNDEAR